MNSERNPKVTVLLPVYNAERYLATALDSVLEQSFTDFECLVINDGSTDSSPEIIKNYQAKDARLRVISRPNKGLIATLNEGLGAARGEFVARMDADDICLPDRLQKQVELLDSRPEVGVCGTDVEAFDDESGYSQHMSAPTTHENCMVKLLFGTPLYHPTVMYRKNLIFQNDLYYSPEYIHCEDYELWMRFAEHTSFANINEILLRYRAHEQQVSVAHNDTTVKSQLKALDNYLGKLKLAFSDTQKRTLIVRQKHENGMGGLLELYREVVRANEQSGFLLDQNSLLGEMNTQLQKAVVRFYGLPGYFAYKGSDFSRSRKSGARSQLLLFARSLKCSLRSQLGRVPSP